MTVGIGFVCFAYKLNAGHPAMRIWLYLFFPILLELFTLQ